MINYTAIGSLTGGSSSIQTTLILPKRINDVTPSITGGSVTIRKPDGGYLEQGAELLNNFNISLSKKENILDITLTKSTSYSSPNNVPISIRFNSLVLSFT